MLSFVPVPPFSFWYTPFCSSSFSRMHPTLSLRSKVNPPRGTIIFFLTRFSESSFLVSRDLVRFTKFFFLLFIDFILQFIYVIHIFIHVHFIIVLILFSKSFFSAFGVFILYSYTLRNHLIPQAFGSR